ncbi:MAG: tRNA (pseudouridine(54)-N(1))-methyltransferase TrmY [archaeon]
MREFIYFSKKARTSGNWTDLMQAGRMDIVCHVIINSLFLSHKVREDAKLHLVFYGAPDPPKHLEMQAGLDSSLEISKKDISGLIKRMLYKYKKGRKFEVWKGFFIEKKSLMKLIDELKDDGKEIYVLDSRGEDIRKAEIQENAVFLLGDHDGLDKHDLKRLKKENKLVSLGKRTYFASQSITILNNELDRREV